jgi:NADPH-dependent 7-cyano-7-deazaguanine reductase QueF-like protein
MRVIVRQPSNIDTSFMKALTRIEAIGTEISIDLDSNVRIETVSLTLALDAVNSTPARLFQETVEQAMSRISQDMQAKGSALVE